MIEERKKALSIPSSGIQKSSSNNKDKKPQMTTDFEKQAKIAQLQVFLLFQNIISTELPLIDYINVFIFKLLGSNSKEISIWYY